MQDRILVVVSTCPREPSYLAETLRSLDAAGASAYERWILSDGAACAPEHLLAGWANTGCVGTEPRMRSVRNNLWGAFRLAARRQAQRLLFFEDDVIACRRAVERMATVAIPDEAAFMTFHDVKEMPQGAPHGVHLTRDMHGFGGLGLWGTQALAMPLERCEYLAERDPFAVRPRFPHRGGDRVLEHYLSISPWSRYAIHMPCLVRHVGVVSVVFPDKTLKHRPTTNWPGPAFDAMSMR